VPIAPLPGAKPDMNISYPSAENSPYEMAMAKHAIKAQDPALMPHTATRQVLGERMGAGYRTSVSVAPAIAHEAGALQAHGRILPSSINRSSMFEFDSGEADRN